VIIRHLLADTSTLACTSSAPNYYDHHVNTVAKRRNHIRQLEALGYKVTLEPATWRPSTPKYVEWMNGIQFYLTEST
jgi:hypothetical protein